MVPNERPRRARPPGRAALCKNFSIPVNLLPLPGVFVSERGRESLLDEYIRQYGRRLYGLCRTLCRDPFDADDLYQETWLRALRHWEQYDLAREFEPWLTRICVNTYRSALRRLARSPVFDRFSSSEEKEAVLAAAPAPEGEDFSELHAAVDALPEKLRLAVILFYFRDMDLASAARALNIPPGTMKSRLNHARNRLKEALSHETDLPF